MATREQIAKLVGVMAAAFPHAQVTQETIHVYCRVLADIPWEELEPAALQCLADSEFMPTIAKIRNKVHELRRLQAPEPSAFEAWQEVQTAVQARHHKTPEFSCERIADALCQTMGRGTVLNALNALALTDVDDVINFIQPRFLRCYDQVAGKARTDQAMLPEVRDLARTILNGQAVALEVDHE